MRARIETNCSDPCLSAKVEFCTERFVIAGLFRHPWIGHIALRDSSHHRAALNSVTSPRSSITTDRLRPPRDWERASFQRLFALRYTHDFEGDLAIILSNNLAFEPHT